MTMAEAATWAKYRAKRGSLNTSLRIESGFAQVLSVLYSAFGKKHVKAEDFMPYVIGKTAVDDSEPAPDKLFGVLASIANASPTNTRHAGTRRKQKRRDKRLKKHGQ